VLDVPPSYDGQTPAPLVLLFHGFGGNGRSILDYSGFGATADRHGYIAVAPDGQGAPRFWNVAMSTDAADDVAFVRQVLDEVTAGLCIDSHRVYAAGFSNGGGMALRLACDMPGTVAAVGVVASMFPQCAATPATPLIAFHGTSDPELPFNGGRLPDEATDFPPVRRVVSEWAVGLGCDGLARISRPAAHVELSTFVRCLLGDGEALLYTIIDGGHTWPGAAIDLPAMSGPTNHEVDASELIAAFFDARGGPR
jgi:polyhydroxybutyrate depolymerase